jgi:hypothetical protein
MYHVTALYPMILLVVRPLCEPSNHNIRHHHDEFFLEGRQPPSFLPNQSVLLFSNSSTIVLQSTKLVMYIYRSLNQSVHHIPAKTNNTRRWHNLFVLHFLFTIPRRFLTWMLDAVYLPTYLPTYLPAEPQLRQK